MSKTFDLRGWSLTFFCGKNKCQMVQITGCRLDYQGEPVSVLMPLREFRELQDLSQEEIKSRLDSLPPAESIS